MLLKNSKYFSCLRVLLTRFLGFYLLALSFFFLNRLVLLIRFSPEHLFRDFGGDVLKSFWTGSRFDTQIILYAALPLLAVAFICALFPFGKGQFWFNKIFMVYASVTLSLMVALLIFDQGYYSFFKSHYDSIVFGIVQDDTGAVLKSIWTDHPVVRVFLVLSGCIFVIIACLKRIRKWDCGLFRGGGLLLQLSVFVIFLGVLFLGLRGSLGTFPLEKDDTTISQSAFVNFLTPNALFCLNEAYKEKERSFHDFDNGALIREFGYAEPGAGFRAYFGEKNNNSLFSRTLINPFLEKNPPNVVFVQMESFSNYYLDFQNDTSFNLLGSLSQHFKSDLLFRNFISDENGTIPSLESLMTGVPYHPIAQTAYKLTALPSSVALPFKAAGYETIFVTGGKLGWRNLGEFVPKQGFDKVAGQAGIARQVPRAEVNEWGVYDEYLFEYVYQLLRKAGAKPKFIFVMTTSNHTPYTLPVHYKPLLILMTDRMKQLTGNNPKALDNFRSYQYSANCLGDFLSRIKASGLKANTIVGATGDHNTLMLFQFDESRLHLKRGVPFYLYAPKAYLKGKTRDTKRFGSHKDIFPTLFNLSLSGQPYFNTGNDLLSGDSSVFFFGVNEEHFAVSEKGAVLNFPGRNVRYFKWNNPAHTRLEECAGNPADSLLLQKATSRKFLLRYYFNALLGDGK